MKREILFNQEGITELELENNGVYKLVNTTNDDFYIGSTFRSFKERFKEHCAYYERSREENHTPILWNAFDKYGIENFKIEILEVINEEERELILEREEYYIKELKPYYNICQEPTKGGSPNKGRKLSKEWKEKIAKKSSEYRHDEKTLKKVTKNNKRNGVKTIFEKEGRETLTFNTWKEAADYFETSSSSIQNANKRKGMYKGWKITRLSKQAKKIKVFFENEEKIFKSYAECDRYLDMWNGYTSELINSKRPQLLKDKYKFELL